MMNVTNNTVSIGKIGKKTWVGWQHCQEQL